MCPICYCFFLSFSCFIFHICLRDRCHHIYFIVWKMEAQASGVICGKPWITWMLQISPSPILYLTFYHQYLACVARTHPYQDTFASFLDPSTFSSMAFVVSPSSTQDFLFLPVDVLASLSSFKCLMQPLKTFCDYSICAFFVVNLTQAKVV